MDGVGVDFDWVGLNSTRFDLDHTWMGLDWIGLDWIGRGWIGFGLDWSGSDWIGSGLDWIGLDLSLIHI